MVTSSQCHLVAVDSAAICRINTCS
jgi:hypothetical protein